MFNNPGNQYALKWTPEITLETLHRVNAEARKEETHYLTMALDALGLNRRAWRYWKQKFINDDDILDLIDIIEGVFEAKLFVGSLMGKVHPTTAIFGLKNNHHWSDHHEAQPSAKMNGQGQQAQTIAPREPAIIKMPDGRVISLP